jgi:hypothetical protein
MPVEVILAAIAKYGEPCGIVAFMLLDKGKRVEGRAIVIPFRKDPKSRKALEQSATEANARFDKIKKQIWDAAAKLK